MTNQPYEVLWQQEEQDESGADYTQWCSDGLIRQYRVSAFITTPSDGGSKSKVTASEPTWVTKERQELKVGEMLENHRRVCLKYNYARRHQAEASLGLLDDTDDEDPTANRIRHRLTEKEAGRLKRQAAIAQFWINVFKKGLASS